MVAYLLAFSLLINSSLPLSKKQSLIKKCKKDYQAAWTLLVAGESIKKCIIKNRRKNRTFKRFLLISQLQMHGKIKKALKLAKKYLKTKKSIPLIRIKASELYWYAGEKDKYEGEIDRILDDYRRKFIGKNPWELYAANLAAIQKRDWDTAEEISTTLYTKYSKFIPGLLSGAKYDREVEFYSRAKRIMKSAHRLQPDNPAVSVEYGKVLLLSPYGEKTGYASILAKNAIKINPEYFEAYILLSKLALKDLEYKTVEKNIKKADKIFRNFPDTLTVKAGVALLKEDNPKFKIIENTIKRLYPLNFNHYYALGRILNRHHRYKLCVRELKKGLKVAPSNVPILAWLGLSLLRIGDEGHGYYYLKKASEINPDHVMAYNISTLFTDTIFPKYISVRKGPFVYRVPKKEWPVIKLLVPPILEAAFKRYQSHYKYTPPLPVKIEFFKDKKDFTVLIAGHPMEIGILGVCFGQVISFLSPSSAAANWAMVISHELAHTFHIELSHGKVPRWFTEGLAEFETAYANLYWKRESSRRIYMAMQEGKLKSVAKVNRSFTHAKSQLEMVTAYIYSTWLIRFIYLKGGWSALRKALIIYQKGGDTPKAIKGALGWSVKEFDQRFLNYLRLTLSVYKNQFSPSAIKFHSYKELKDTATKSPNEKNICRLAYYYFRYGNRAGFNKLKKKCMKINKNNKYLLFIDLRNSLKLKNPDISRKIVDKLIKTGNDGYEVRTLFASILKLLHKNDEAIIQLQAAHSFDPEAVYPINTLALIYYKNGDYLGAIHWLKILSRYQEGASSFAKKIVELSWKQKLYNVVSEFGLLLIQSDPFNAGESLYKTGYSLIKSGFTKLALTPLLVYRILKNNDHNGKTRLLLAKALIANKNYKKAKILLKELIHVYPGLTEARELSNKLKGLK